MDISDRLEATPDATTALKQLAHAASQVDRIHAPPALFAALSVAQECLRLDRACDTSAAVIRNLEIERLRDDFAVRATPAALADALRGYNHISHTVIERASRLAYEIADGMLKAREAGR